MRIEALDRRDQAAVATTAGLYARVFAEHPWYETWSEEAALQVVRDPLLRWWIARNDSDRAVGFIAGVVAKSEDITTRFGIPAELIRGSRIGYKAELGVAPELRRAGLARCLTSQLLDWFREEQIEHFLVRTRPGTGNHPWYSTRLVRLHTYADGRVVFGARGVPEL